MCWPWTHKWKTVDTFTSKLFEAGYDSESALPVRTYRVYEQQCEKCGKQIVRKYRVL